ncbi:hypothetical protein EPN83_00270 [Patescibacteria group bacterium]|nr:MAG: hypothetical protein EPN83_00270 [Patescibacteria group bacterium]
MFETIARWRQKPEGARRRIAFGLSAIVTALIFLVWVSVIFPGSRTQVVTAKPAGETPIATLRSGVAQAYEALRGIFSETKSLDLESEYNRIRSQVESGEIKLVPGSE